MEKYEHMLKLLGLEPLRDDVRPSSRSKRCDNFIMAGNHKQPIYLEAWEADSLWLDGQACLPVTGEDEQEHAAVLPAVRRLH